MYKEVWITNYFYEGTIEDIIYQRLKDRIDWFEVVVGDLQPILAEVGETTRRLAMLPAEIRDAQLEKEIDALEQRLKNRELELLNLDAFAVAGNIFPEEPSPVTLPDLEVLLTQSGLTAALFKPHSTIKQAYLLGWQGQSLPITFSAACFDEHPDTVKFLSYGSTLLNELLASIPAPVPGDTGALVRFTTDSSGLDMRTWYVLEGEQPKAIESLTELRNWLQARGKLTSASGASAHDDTAIHEAEKHFADQVQTVRTHQAEVIQRRQVALAMAEKAKGQRLLVKAALVELALGQQKALFEKETYPAAFNETAIRGLQRHGYPWGALLQLTYEDGLSVDEGDDYYQQIKGSSRDSLMGRIAQLTEEAKRMVKSLNNTRVYDLLDHQHNGLLTHVTFYSCT